MRKLALGVFLILIVGACASVKPMPIRVGEGCFLCRDPILDKRLAAQLIGGSLATNFETPGCLATYLVEHPADQGVVFVTDFVSGSMVEAPAAVYVPTLESASGKRDYIAFKEATDAQSEATARSTSPVAWDVVLERARQGQRGN